MSKQVIVIRKDLKMRRGKECAQTAHASIAWLTRRLQRDGKNKFSCNLSVAEQDWISGSFAKIVLQVESEKDLLDIYEKAKNAKLIVEIIKDAGHTEVEPGTITCLAIGPDEESRIDLITQNLKLY